MEESAAKRLKTGRIKGVASIKPEFQVGSEGSQSAPNNNSQVAPAQVDDEEPVPESLEPSQKKKGGQNKARQLQQKKDTVRYCDRRMCVHGDECRYEHDLDVYLASKPQDLPGTCPVYEAIGYCPTGVRCRWLRSHFEEKKLPDIPPTHTTELNWLDNDNQRKLSRKQYDFSKSDAALKKMDAGAASYQETPLKPSEKKYLNYSGAKVLSPLTTVGNLPYRRLMKTLGADITFSEMAMAMPLLSGQRSEWALARAHPTEMGSFALQMAAARPWHAAKAAQAISDLCGTGVSEINLNCGCPIDLLYRQGAGSALLESPSKVSKILKTMNSVTDLPVTIKLRMGTRDNHPTAKTLITRLLEEEQVGCITLHGRSRQQRYSREADWDYVREVAELVRSKRETKAVKPFLVGNGDVYSWEDWYDHLENTGVDTCMVARGALIKPWIFEEIDARQYLDKSASERLEYVRRYAEFGLEHWGSDEYGVNQTRRFLCEWLSFTYRYIPVEMLEYLPPKLNERPEAWRGRSELEELLASGDYRDWIKITEMFLGPAGDDFVFVPKHKSNAY